MCNAHIMQSASTADKRRSRFFYSLNARAQGAPDSKRSAAVAAPLQRVVGRLIKGDEKLPPSNLQ